MKRKFTSRTTVFAAFTALALLSLTVGAGAFQGEKKFRLLDDCEPTTFNAVLGDGACVGNGHTTFAEFIEELEATQDAHKWRNQPSQAHLNIGRSTLIENRGGEVHTFTPVANFGGGFVAELNGISGNPVPAPECLNFGSIVFIPPGGTEDGPTAGSSELPVGITRFQCCIHPWMRTVVEVADHAAPPEQAKPNAHAHH
ncbi:MAG TPA: hypothetical protein VFB70_08000 [Pyrinomonadaceae bacterium]|jgi:hypothetical protein|nr:hypothetical protein [Pyrinomonadaceae bacterium]